MSSSILRIAAGLLAWGGCLIASLSIAIWPGDLGHGICGPWGCGPPLQALIACHLAWLVALVPPAGWLVWFAPVSSRLLKRLGMLLVTIAAGALLAMIANQWLSWWPQSHEWQRPYFWQRYGFTIATAVDYPLLQALFVGMWMWRAGRFRLRELPGFPDRVEHEREPALSTTTLSEPS